MKHKKTFVMIATLVTILLLAFSLAACHKTSGDDNNNNPDTPPSPPTPPAPTEFTVTFDSCGGNTVPSVKGKTVQTEPLPEKDGFDFVGWYENSDYSGNRVVFPYTISKDVKFYAKWQEKATHVQSTLDDFEYTEADGVVTLTKYIGEKTNIILPDEANVLGSDLFSESIVESVVFTAGVKEVNKTAFYWASNLKSIEVVNENPYFSAQDGILFNKDKTALVVYPFAKSNDNSNDGYSISQGVKKICLFAFAGYHYANIEFPEGLTEIEDYAFYYAKMGKAILPDGVTNIGDYAFAYCTNMTELNIPQSTESCGDKYSVVKGCRKLEKLTAPANVLQGSMSLASLKTLVINGGTSSMGSLSGCGNLETVVLPEGLTDITTRAFKDCKNLTTINLPSTLTTINQNAFEGCEKITSLTMPSSLKTIGKNAFLNSGLENVVLNEGLTEISGGAFDNTKITSIKIPDSLTRCTYWTNVKTLETVYCPAKWADSLYGYQYQNEASTIRHLYITSGTTIATPKAQGLVSISLPASITSTTLNLRFQYALCQVTNLSACNITLPDDFAGEYRTSESDAFSGTFEKDDKDMLVYKYQEKVVALKYYGSKTQIGESDLAGYTDIAPYAFYKKDITSVVLPANIKTVGYEAFAQCSSLTDVTMKGVEKLASWAFFNCSALQTVYLPATLKTIKGAPFMYCGTKEEPLTIKCAYASAPSGWENTWMNTDRGTPNIIWNA